MSEKEFIEIPEDWYVVKCVKAEFGKSKKGRRQLAIQSRILCGEYKKLRIFDYISCETEKGEAFANDVYRMLSQNGIGKDATPIVAHVYTREGTARDGSTFTMRNVKYHPASEKQREVFKDA